MQNQIKKTWIISDIHGCLEEFEKLLNIISYNQNKDNIILVGDLIDRGYDSVGVVRKARELNFQSVMGNHEYKFLKNPKNKKYSRYNFNDEDIQYLKNLPTYIKLKDYIIVHAGLKPNIKLEGQNSLDLMTIRYIDENNNHLGITQVSKLCNRKFGLELSNKDEKFFDKLNDYLKTRKKDLGIKFWTDFWNGSGNIVYGHSVHSTSYPLIEETSPDVFCYGIDTGCVFGGFLTAFCIETKEIVQVKSNYRFCQ